MIGKLTTQDTCKMNADMIFPLRTDHVLGRPSVQFRKTQVFAVLAVWLVYLGLYVLLLEQYLDLRLLIHPIAATSMARQESDAYPPFSRVISVPGRYS